MSHSEKPRVPSYRHHKATGQARVTIEGRDHYLGKFGTAESRAKYQRLIVAFLAGMKVDADTHRPSPSTLLEYPVGRLCGDFLDWAKREYRNADGSETRSVENVRQALRALFELFADVDATEFGPRSLKLLREQLVGRSLARSTVNDRIAIVKRAFKWAVENERVPPSVWHGLSAVAGLRAGRGGVRETAPVLPAREEDVRAALPFMPEPVRAMVELQLLTGARPCEVTRMRGADIDQSSAVWVYQPASHKNAWRGHERSIYIGPKAQGILRPYLADAAPERPLFSPTVAELRRRERLRRERRVPLYPSHLRALERKRIGRPKRHLRDQYDVGSYRQAIARACRRAGVAVWKPNQLRHNAATRLRAEFSLDVAKAVLGHRRVETTQIYAENDRERARQAVERTG